MDQSCSTCIHNLSPLTCHKYRRGIPNAISMGQEKCEFYEATTQRVVCPTCRNVLHEGSDPECFEVCHVCARRFMRFSRISV